MHIPRFNSSRHSRKQDLSDAGSVPEAPKPKHPILKLFGFGRPRPQAPPQPDSGSAIGVAPSSLSPLNPAPDSVIADHRDTPGTSARPPSRSPQPAASLVELNITSDLNPDSSVTPPSIHRASPSPIADHNSRQHQDVSVIPQPSPASVSQQSLLSPAPTVPPRQHSPQPSDGNSNQLQVCRNVQVTHDSRDVTIDGNHNYVHYGNTFISNPNNFMEKLLRETIQGAAFDSSARDPPPRCHPGTRLAVIARCLEFIANATGKKKLRWVVGQAGVGKSAIMQNVAESPLPSISERASIFLSINGRNDGTKIIITLIYQFATKCQSYREFIELEIGREPSLLQSSMSVQFKKFLVEPFINNTVSSSVGRVLIIIDGLDECNNLRSQEELLRLISDACSTYPSSPIVWIVASRPEAHITSFFNQDDAQGVYEKEEIEVDSDEARSDVERFLRAELAKIQKRFSLSPRSQWPSEQDLWKLASASGGLFAFAQTVVKYIGDPEFGDPISQLKDVLKAIDALPLLGVPREQHPLALLDALYARIISKVPERIMVNTRKILLALVSDLQKNGLPRKGGFLALCNWLGMTCDEAYAAIRHLGSVLSAPKRGEAHKKKLQPFHKSFIDYLSDFTRSGFSSDIKHEAQQLEDQHAIRILEQAPGGISYSKIDYYVWNSEGNIIGHLLTEVPCARSDIVLTWSTDGDGSWSDNKTRVEVYKWAIANVVEGIKTGHSVFCTEFYIRIIIGQLRYINTDCFPIWQLLNLVFEKSRHHEFIKGGILERVPIEGLDLHMTWEIKLQFCRPFGITHLSDPWDPSCEHERICNWEKGKGEDWTTEFSMAGCEFCCQRLKQQLENWKTQSLDHDVTVLLTSFDESFVEFHFIDPDDGVSEWTYWTPLKIPKEKRRKPGSVV